MALNCEGSFVGFGSVWLGSFLFWIFFFIIFLFSEAVSYGLLLSVTCIFNLVLIKSNNFFILFKLVIFFLVSDQSCSLMRVLTEEYRTIQFHLKDDKFIDNIIKMYNSGFSQNKIIKYFDE